MFEQLDDTTTYFIMIWFDTQTIWAKSFVPKDNNILALYFKFHL